MQANFDEASKSVQINFYDDNFINFCNHLKKSSEPLKIAGFIGHFRDCLVEMSDFLRVDLLQQILIERSINLEGYYMFVAFNDRKIAISYRGSPLFFSIDKQLDFVNRVYFELISETWRTYLDFKEELINNQEKQHFPMHLKFINSNQFGLNKRFYINNFKFLSTSDYTRYVYYYNIKNV